MRNLLITIFLRHHVHLFNNKIWAFRLRFVSFYTCLVIFVIIVLDSNTKAIILNRQFPLRNHINFLHMGQITDIGYISHNTADAENKSQTTYHTTHFNAEQNKYYQALLSTDNTALFSTDHIQEITKQTWIQIPHHCYIQIM